MVALLFTLVNFYYFLKEKQSYYIWKIETTKFLFRFLFKCITQGERVKLAHKIGPEAMADEQTEEWGSA